MKTYSKEDIQNLDRIARLNLANSLSGVKQANLIGTISDNGRTNLAIFNSVMHLSSSPALMGLIMRPDDKVRRHTLENMRSTGSFTINHVHESFIEKAHYTSAKFDEDQSEFDTCKLTPHFDKSIQAPFVKESKLAIGMTVVEEIPIPRNGTYLIMGEIELVIFESKPILEQRLDLSEIGSIGVSALNTYYKLEKVEEFPYARPDELPDFEP